MSSAYSSMDLSWHILWAIQNGLHSKSTYTSSVNGYHMDEHRMDSPPLHITSDWHTLSSEGKNLHLSLTWHFWLWGKQLNTAAGMLCDVSTSLPANPTQPPLCSSPYSVAQGKQGCFPCHTVTRLCSQLSQEGRISNGIWASHPRQTEPERTACACAGGSEEMVYWLRDTIENFITFWKKIGNIKAGVLCQMLELNALLIWLASVTWALNVKHQ